MKKKLVQLSISTTGANYKKRGVWLYGLKDVCDSYIRTQWFSKMELNRST